MLYALRTLRSRGMDDNVLQQVFKSVIFGRMTYAASSWWGYSTAADKQRLDAFIRHAVRARLYPADGPSLQQLFADGDDAFFERIQTNEHHLLRELLPITTSLKYGLRSRRHNFTVNNKSETDDRNFVTRLLFKDICTDSLFYSFIVNSCFTFCIFSYCTSCVLTTFH